MERTVVLLKAVVMAGGEGTRLRPLTCTLPKPMVPVGNRPLIDYILQLLAHHKFSDVSLTLQFMPDIITSYVGNGRPWRLKVKYYVEHEPMGTAGGVKNAVGHSSEPLLVISGDALTDIDLKKLVQFHKDRSASVTIALKRVPASLEYGLVLVNQDGRISRFLEKPSWGEIFSDIANTGIYVIDPDVLEEIPQGRPYDFSKDLFPRLLEAGYPIYGYLDDFYWCDVGSQSQYLQANMDVLSRALKFEPKGTQVEEGVWYGEDVKISQGVKVLPPAVIGDGVSLEKGASLEGYVVIGSNCDLARGSSVKRSVVWDRCFVGPRTELRGAIVCTGARLKADVKVFDGAVIGTDTVVGKGTQVKSGVSIWPQKVVGEALLIKEDVVWGARPNAVLRASTVSGVFNVELPPELLVKLGSAVGSWVKEGDSVVVGYDGGTAAQLSSLAVIAGVLSTGVHALNAGICTPGVVRYITRAMGVHAGVHVRANSEGETVLEICDAAGLPLSREAERKVETLLGQTAFRRHPKLQMGMLRFLPGVLDAYTRWALSCVDVGSIRRRGFKVVVPGGGEAARRILPKWWDLLGCTVAGGGLETEHDDVVARRKLPDERWNWIGEEVVRRGADFGASIFNSGERLQVWDERGSLIPDNELDLITLTALITDESVPVVIPGNLSHAMIEMAKLGKVLKGKVSSVEFVRHVAKLVDHKAQGRLGQVELWRDGFVTMLKLMEHLARKGLRFSELRDGIPRPKIVQEVVPCPWEAKGTLMRRLVEETKGERVELDEGVKVITKNGWTLVVPDPEKPVYNIYSEGDTWEVSRELAGLYADLLRKLKAEVGFGE